MHVGNRPFSRRRGGFVQLVVIALSLIASVTMSRQVFAATSVIPVGNGTPASCTNTALQAVMQTTTWAYDNLTVTFNCGASPVTIDVMPLSFLYENGQINVYPNKTLDGGTEGLITLRMTGSGRFLYVNHPGKTVTLKNMVFTNGVGPSALCSVEPCGGGAVAVQSGKLNLSNSTFSGNTTGKNGGAIWKLGGTVTVSDNTFSGNTAAGGDGGAIYVQAGLGFPAQATVTHSTFSNNTNIKTH